MAITEQKTIELSGDLESSGLLKQGLPLFFQQLIGILLLERPAITKKAENKKGASAAAVDSNETEIAIASGKPEEVELAKTAALHGTEMFRLGYTLSHVVHSYGAICQAITELAEKMNFEIDVQGFHDLNQCLDVAIASSVNEYQKDRDLHAAENGGEDLEVLVYKLKNMLTSAIISFQMIQRGMVGVSGTTGTVLGKSLIRMQDLIENVAKDSK